MRTIEPATFTRRIFERVKKRANGIMDETSFKILKILREKARIPNVEVARQVGMAPSAVLERIRKLEKQGIIDGYEVRLNPERFGRSMVSFVYVKTGVPAKDAEVGEALSKISEVQEVHFVAGEDCWLVKIRVSGTDELGTVIRRKIASIEGVVSTRTSIALSTIKETSGISLDGIKISDRIK